ncbi:MAG TPA: DUF1566 domain-containing protein [Polyangiaceae bacterium]|jgi:hypothetical protein|nr:DUF1566 domain-containing protein [Polyangiaceae bacterium]
MLPLAGASCNAATDVRLPRNGDEAGLTGDAACVGAPGGSIFANWPMPDPSTAGTDRSPTYDTTSTDVVVDRLTQLTWQRNLEPKSYLWSDADAYCRCLAVGGHDDWRLPTRIELVSIVDFTKPSPAIDSNAFPGTPGDYFWTSSPLIGNSSAFWYVYFFDGNTHSTDASSSYRVRCVSGTPRAPPNRYTIAGDGSVLDTATGLDWQQNPDTTARNWQDAKAYCAGLAPVDGRWRLPNMKELQTLIDESKMDPAIDTSAFPGTAGQAFWTASLLASTLPEAWFVNFYTGVSYTNAESNLYLVRCVR